MARKFFYVCAGMFLLALSYHFGASNAGAQAPSNPIVAASFNMAVTANGDVYLAENPHGPWSHVSNVFSGSTTPALHESWGQLKARYRGNPVSTAPGTTDR